MNATILTNRSSEPPKDGWYQIEVTGDWPAGRFADGKPRRQVIDRKALESIVNRFVADKAAAGDAWTGILVDADHLSHDEEKSTEAMAWLQEVEIRDDERGTPQLWGRLDLTDIGETAVRNRRYKRFSTEYPEDALEPAGDGRVRPLRLTGLAFTNRPNNKGGKPISNRDGDEPGGEQHETKPSMQPIALKLGLPADADEAAILKKLTDVMSELETLKAKTAEGDAEKVMNRFGDRIPEAARAHWKAELIRNREAAEKLMDSSFPEKAETQTRIVNREGLKTPAPVGNGDAASQQANEKAAKVRARATEIQNREKIPFNQAFARAQSEAN